MKKILVLMVLSLVGFTTLFGCESAFDGIKGITCELQYALCSDTDMDITFCDSSIKEKVEQYEKDSSENQKQRKEIGSLSKKVKNEIKEMRKNPENFDDNRFFFLIEEEHRLDEEIFELCQKGLDITDEFLGEESLKLMMSEEFTNEVFKVLGE